MGQKRTLHSNLLMKVKWLRRKLARRLISRRLFAESRAGAGPVLGRIPVNMPQAAVNQQPYVPEKFPTEFPSKHRLVWVPTRLKKHPLEIRIYVSARLVGSSPIGVTQTGHVIRNTISHRRSLIETVLTSGASSVRKDSRRGVGDRWDGYNMLLQSRFSNFGHWILEHLCKVIYLQTAAPEISARCAMVLDADAEQWKRASLELLGVRPDQVRVYQRPLRPIEVEKLVVPSYPEPHMECLRKLSDTFLARARDTGIDTDLGERLILSRTRFEEQQALTRRYVNNEEALAAALEPMGFRRVFPEELSLLQQATVFEKARIVIGANGSAFTNIIHMRPGGHVLELFGNRVDLGFRQLALEMGLTHHIVYGNPIPETLTWQHGGRFLDGAFDVDTRALRLLIEKLVRS